MTMRVTGLVFGLVVLLGCDSHAPLQGSVVVVSKGGAEPGADADPPAADAAAPVEDAVRPAEDAPPPKGGVEPTHLPGQANLGPHWLPIPAVEGTETDPREYLPLGHPVLAALVCDDEGDAITVEARATPVDGQGPARTFQQTIDFRVTPPLSYELPMICGAFRVPLEGLPAGKYDVAIHATDALGVSDPYGWVPVLRGFEIP